MIFRLFADVTVLLHVAFVLLVVLGGLLAAATALGGLGTPDRRGLGAWVELASWVCPLTPLENWLRTRGGDTAYTSSFIEHYLMPLLYPAFLSRETQYTPGAVVLLVNAVIDAALLRWRARW